MYKYRYLLRRLFSHDYLNSPERQAQTVNNHVSYLADITIFIQLSENSASNFIRRYFTTINFNVRSLRELENLFDNVLCMVTQIWQKKV